MRGHTSILPPLLGCWVRPKRKGNKTNIPQCQKAPRSCMGEGIVCILTLAYAKRLFLHLDPWPIGHQGTTLLLS